MAAKKASNFTGVLDSIIASSAKITSTSTSNSRLSRSVLRNTGRGTKGYSKAWKTTTATWHKKYGDPKVVFAKLFFDTTAKAGKKKKKTESHDHQSLLSPRAIWCINIYMNIYVWIYEYIYIQSIWYLVLHFGAGRHKSRENLLPTGAFVLERTSPADLALSCLKDVNLQTMGLFFNSL